MVFKFCFFFPIESEYKTSLSSVMGKTRRTFRKKASWVTYRTNDKELYYQLNQKGELIKKDNTIRIHHVVDGKNHMNIDTVMSKKANPNTNITSVKEDLDCSLCNPFDLELLDDILGSAFQDLIQPARLVKPETTSTIGNLNSMNFFMSGLEIDPLMFL